MIEQLKLKAEEIINMCNDRIILNNSPNMFEINVIKREFLLIRDSLIKEGKVIVLTKKRDLSAYRTIIDSADFNYDSELFDKVHEFQKACKKVPYVKLKIEHPDI